jgi:hypothetical protein
MLVELLTHMAPGEQKLKQVCAEFGVNAFLTCATEPTSSLTPTILFPPNVVRWAADYNVTVGVDVMLWDDEQD